MAKSTFHHPTPKVKSFPEFAPAFKYKLIPSYFFFFFFFFEMQSILESRDQSDHNMLTPKCFEKLLICVDLYQHAKNQAISLICSGDMVD